MGKKILNSRALYMVLSLLLAVVIWMYVTGDLDAEGTKTLYNVPVVFTGLDELESRGLMISEGQDQTVTIQFQAKRSVLQQLDNENVSVTVDVATITDTGIKTRPDYMPNLPRSVSNDPVTIRSRSPNPIRYTVSRWLEREVEVRGVFSGSVADGYQLGDLSVTPSVITIRGQEELVNQVDYAQITISQTDLASTYTGELPFVLMDFDGTPVSGEKLEISHSAVLASLPVVQLKEVDLTVEVVPGGGATGANADIDISPKTIMVAGDEDDLEGLSEISLGSVELYRIFGTDQLTFKIPLSESLTNVSGVSEATVTVQISDLATRTIEVDNIQFTNVPEGYVPESRTQTRLVMIRGTQEAVDQVIPSQLQIVADLSVIIDPNGTIATGTRTVPVKVNLFGTSEAGVVGDDYNISVNITRE